MTPCHPKETIAEWLNGSPLKQTCRRGHEFLVSRVEWHYYKGVGPYPCPICIRGELRE